MGPSVMASDTLNDNPTAQSDIEGNLLPGTTPAEGYLQLNHQMYISGTERETHEVSREFPMQTSWVFAGM